MKRASYRKGVEWIALNDDPLVLQVDDLAGTISIALLSDLFEVGQAKVIEDVLKIRKRNLPKEYAYLLEE